MPARRLAAVPGPPQDPLFDPPRRSGRVKAALERSLRELRDLDGLERVDAVRVATLRTLVETYDRDGRRDVSTFAMATAARTIVDLFNALAAGAATSTTFDDLVSALSDVDDDPAPPRDVP